MKWLKALFGGNDGQQETAMEPAPAPTTKPVAAATAQKEVARLALNYCLTKHKIPTAAVEVVSITQIDRPSGNPTGEIHLRVKSWAENTVRQLPHVCEDLITNLDRFEHTVIHADFNVRISLEPGLTFVPSVPTLRKVVPQTPTDAKKESTARVAAPLGLVRREGSTPVSRLADQTLISASGKQSIQLDDYHRGSPAFAATDIMAERVANL